MLESVTRAIGPIGEIRNISKTLGALKAFRSPSLQRPHPRDSSRSAIAWKKFMRSPTARRRQATAPTTLQMERIVLAQRDFRKKRSGSTSWEMI